MTKEDQILRAKAILTSLMSHVPKEYEVSERWVYEFHTAIEKVEKATAIPLDEFKIGSGELRRSVSSGNYVTGEVEYRDGLWCEREILMHKLDSVLIYISSLQSGIDRSILTK